MWRKMQLLFAPSGQHKQGGEGITVINIFNHKAVFGVGDGLYEKLMIAFSGWNQLQWT